MTEYAVDDADLEALANEALSAEFSAHTGGRPVTYPLTPFYDSDRGTLFVTSAPAFSSKVDRAREEPMVALLFDVEDDPVLVRGEATVYDDDLEYNARYVRRLIESLPDGHKRGVFEATERKLANPIGNLLLDWYGLRILVEIEPVEVEGFDEGCTSGFEAWPAVDMDSGEADKHSRAVYTYVGDDGPRSLPVTEFDVEGGDAALELAASADVGDGQPCCLLLHWHSSDLTTLGQRMVRGRASNPGGRTLEFDPASSFEMSTEGFLDFLRFIWQGKTQTREYFGETGVTGWTW